MKNLPISKSRRTFAADFKTINTIMETKLQMTIDEAIGNSSLSFSECEIYSKLGVVKSIDKGITISVNVPYPNWCGREEAKALNEKCYNSIISHRDLFTFVRLYGYNSLEDLKDSPYTSISIWIRINHICNQNLLVVTHGHGPNRGELYYRAKDYDDFWDIVKRIKEMYYNPLESHESIILHQNNQMIGTHYMEWEVEIIAKK